MLHSLTPLMSKATGCAALALALTACGGGDGEAPGPGAIPAAATVRISGVAAVGAPVSAGVVACKCASGANASTTTAAGGSYGIDVAQGDFPCALSIAGGTARGKPLAAPLHSVALSPGIANITPLTDLMLASMLGENPATWHARATQGDIGAGMTADRLAQAHDKLGAALAALPGKPVPSPDIHPVTTPFKAQQGDAVDELLERYARALGIAELTHADAAARIAAGEQLTQTVYTAHAFTVPGWTRFPIGRKKLPDGSEVLVLPDPTLGTKLFPIGGWDAEGNIARVGRSNEFTAVLSLMGNRIGMLSGRDSHFKHTVSVADESNAHYVYLSDEFTEIDYREVLGKSFAGYQDSKYIRDVVISAEGKLKAPDDCSEFPIDVVQLFSPSGWSEGKGEEATVARAKAYRYTADGKTTYAVVAVIAMDPDVPEALPAEQAVLLMVSR